MADVPHDSLTALYYLLGGGGLTTITLAILGKIRAPKVADSPPPSPAPRIEMETPWMVQNLLEMKIGVETANRQIATLINHVTALTTQVNANTAAIKRRDRSGG